MVLQIMAVPVTSFDTWALYITSWQEAATTIMPVAYGIILIAITYRYFPVLPPENELNYPVEEPVAVEAAGVDRSCNGHGHEGFGEWKFNWVEPRSALKLGGTPALFEPALRNQNGHASREKIDCHARDQLVATECDRGQSVDDRQGD